MAKYLNPYRALSNRSYRYFWAVQSISLIGTWIDTTLRGWVAVNLFAKGGAGTFVGLIAFLKGFPSVVFSPIAGVLIDWFGAKAILFLTQLIDAINAFVMAYLVWKDVLSATHLLVLSFAMGVTAGFYLPSRNNFIGSIVPRDLLSNALALHSMIFNVARMVGPTLAGIMVRLYGLQVGFVVNALSFVPLLLVLPFIDDGSRGKTGGRGLKAFLSDLGEGLVYSYRSDVLRRTFVSLSVFSVFGMPFGMLMQVFVKDVLESDITRYGLVMGLMGAGAFIGANLVSLFHSERLVRFREEILLVVIGAGVLVSAVFPKFVPLVALVIGSCQSSFFNITNSRTQLSSPASMRGRTMAVYSFINTAGAPVGTFVLGMFSSLVGTRLTYLAAGVVVFSFALVRLLRGHSQV